MAFERVIFKDGTARWLRTGDTIPFGHREIGELMLERYVIKRMMKEYRENANVSTLPRFSGVSRVSGS